MTITKKDLIRVISAEMGFSSKLSQDLVNRFFNTIKDELNSGKKIKLSGFGTFELVETKERVGRNPKTMKSYPIPSTKKVKFTLSNKAKRIIN
mgnify:CR=1 FL=1|tara:strand:- start:6996 stop:7274 length:279 start_codon:yes stop_codon:yes gene_type:complete